MSANNFQKISIDSSKKIHIIDMTGKISDLVRASGVDLGVCHVFVPHTTAAVTINENADPDVKSDIAFGLNNIVKDDPRFQHAEGNSQAHIMTSMIGSSEVVLVEDGQLVLGTWQGIYFCEFDGPRNRKVYVKIVEG